MYPAWASTFMTRSFITPSVTGAEPSPPTLMNNSPRPFMEITSGSSSVSTGRACRCLWKFYWDTWGHIGAVTMKITNRTNITSMYGTTLISETRRFLRLNRRAITHPVGARDDDCSEFIGEVLISHSEAVNFRIEPIVGNHRWNRSKQTDRCGNQGLRNTWRNCCQCGLFTVAKPRNEFIIPQTVPNKPMYGLIEPTVARNGRCASTVPLSHGPRASHGTPSITASGSDLPS